MQLNTESPRDTALAPAQTPEAALPRPPLPAAALDLGSVILMWAILILSGLLYRALRIKNPLPDIFPAEDAPSVPITPCDVQRRRQRK